MVVPLGRRMSQIVFETVASIVELAYIAANVVSDQEFTTRVFFGECFDIKDEIIEKHKLFSFGNPLIKILSRHRFLVRFQ